MGPKDASHVGDPKLGTCVRVSPAIPGGQLHLEGKGIEIQAMNTFILAIRRFVVDVVRGVGRASEAEEKLTYGRWP